MASPYSYTRKIDLLTLAPLEDDDEDEDEIGCSDDRAGLTTADGSSTAVQKLVALY